MRVMDIHNAKEGNRITAQLNEKEVTYEFLIVIRKDLKKIKVQ